MRPVMFLIDLNPLPSCCSLTHTHTPTHTNTLLNCKPHFTLTFTNQQWSSTPLSCHTHPHTHTHTHTHTPFTCCSGAAEPTVTDPSLDFGDLSSGVVERATGSILFFLRVATFLRVVVSFFILPLL